MKEKNIPQSVIDEAQDLIQLYGNTLIYRGVYNDCDIYQFVFPENMETGFPFIYLHDVEADQVLEISGSRALKMLRELSDRQTNK